MDLITTQEFLYWAAERGVVPNARYSHPERDYYNLRFDSGSDDAPALYEVWQIPHETEDHQQDAVALYYVSSALTALSPWQTVGLLKKERGWPRFGLDPWEAATLAPLGIPDSYDGAVSLNRTEFATLYSISLAFSVYGWCVAQDLFVVPDHG